ncbi:MAG: glycosyltransferase family 2 protein [Anaerolineae bacterium]|nr:glycosyltransferase family 2 protein [Anaerolineae bacterium]
MFCSTIIPTVGRPSLNRAVESVLNQQFLAAGFEVIVVNDSSTPLVSAPWQNDKRVQIIHTLGHERSVARNTGAAVARGLYFHFLDDDDWLLPGALQRLYDLAHERKAAWVYGGTQLVNRQGDPLIKVRPAMNGNCFIQAIAGEWVPLQASLIRADAFFTIGGFNPLLAGPEDNDLLRRIALTNSLIGTEEIVVTVEWRETASTTNYDQHPEQSRWAREQILEASGAFTRMRLSAASSYWHGRIIRAYLTSTVWNLCRGQILVGASRCCHAVAALLYAGRYWFSPAFLRAIVKSYDSDAFHRGEIEASAAPRPMVN